MQHGCGSGSGTCSCSGGVTSPGAVLAVDAGKAAVGRSDAALDAMVAKAAAKAGGESVTPRTGSEGGIRHIKSIVMRALGL